MKDLNLLPEIMIALERMKISVPTEIQKQTIPVAMQGRDILASSQTGSGKTLAYLIPTISSLQESKGKALVLVPTRELATQVRDALNQISGSLRTSSAIIIGGEPMPKQYNKLSTNPKIIIGTPGRIIDHLNRGSLKLNETSVVVLDEMDRMLDMGMREQIEEIVKFLPAKKQMLMFSATMPKHIIALSQKFLNDPHHVTVGSASKPASTITQESIRLSVREKLPRSLKLLAERQGSVIIFTKTKRGADELAKNLKAEGHKCDAIHGDLRQGRRDRVLLAFRKNLIQILVATDVAARGLDIPHTETVINYDTPSSPEDYLHRIGRTGRAGASGFAFTLVSPEEVRYWLAIEKLMNKGETTSREELLGPKNSKRSQGYNQNSSNRRGGNSYAGSKPRRDYDKKDFSRGSRFGNRSEDASSENKSFSRSYNSSSYNNDRSTRGIRQGDGISMRREDAPRESTRREGAHREDMPRNKFRENSQRENFSRNDQGNSRTDRNFRNSDKSDKNDRNDKSRKFGNDFRRRQA